MNISSLKNNIDDIINQTLNPHPLSFGINKYNVTQLLTDFLAMSEFFPYIQAGAHNILVNRCLAERRRIPDSCKATSVVGAFLCWDEFGGHHKLLNGGLSALPTILETSAFHSSILREDIKQVSPESLGCTYSSITQEYLKMLQKGLSSENPVERVAYMVSFEMNAERMISGLYDSLKELFSLSSQKLTYFEVHVGGDDPAEAYHIETTCKLISGIVNHANHGHFLDYFSQACSINQKWCKNIKNNTSI